MSSKKKSIKKNISKTGKSKDVPISKKTGKSKDTPIIKTGKSKDTPIIKTGKSPIKLKKSPLSKKPDNLSKKNSEDITKLTNLVKKVEKLVKKVENPQPLNNQQIYKNQLEQQIYKDKENLDEKPIPQIKNIDLLDKYGYDIYNDDGKRHDSLGNLVIVYGISDLLKKLDSESMKTPNLSNKFNEDKKWIKNNFGK